MKIILIGYMGSGKSTVGKILAENLKLNYIDLDQYIEEKEQCPISVIFKNKGEIYFRKKEHLYLKELLNTKKSFVLSLGGGTPCYAGNMDLILKSDYTKSFYLELSIPNLVNRLEKEKSQRPLIAELSSENLPEFIAKHLFERRTFYRKANHIINTNTKSVNETINSIQTILS